MKPIPVALELYSLREQAKRDFPAVLKKTAEIGYTGVELAGLYGIHHKNVREMLDDLGLQVVSCHGKLPNQGNLGQIVDEAKTLGYTKHIVNMDRKHMETQDMCKQVAEKLERGAALLKGNDLEMGYHNHDWEFQSRANGKTFHQILMDGAPSVFAQIDTYWVAVGGEDPAQIIQGLGSRVPSIHVKDGPINREQAMQPIGTGKMQWRPIMDALDPKHVQWIIVELDWCDCDMVEAVEKCFRFLVDNGYGR